MKYVRKIAAILLAVSFVLAVCACTPSKKVQNKIYEYLNSKYKGMEFELVDYTQDKETSGKYTINVKCLTTDVDFEIYYTSMFTTDSYSVRWANSVIDPQLDEALGDARSLACVEEIQWLDLYADDSNGYKFREVDAGISYELKDVKEIYRIKLSELDSANEAAQCVYMVITALDKKEVELDKATFEFTVEGKPILFTTDTVSIKQIPLEDLEAKFYTAESSVKDGNILYKNTLYNEINYFLDDSGKEFQKDNP